MRILHVSTVSKMINAFLIPHIVTLIKQGHQVDIACNVLNEIDEKLINSGCNVFNISFSRSLFNKSNLKAYKSLKLIHDTRNYDIVHTHSPIASALTRMVYRKKVNTRVFYTAHGFHFYKGAPSLNWLIYYPIEKMLSKYTDTLITMNYEDYERAKSKFNAKKILYLPGVWIDLKKFNKAEIDRDLKRVELGLSKDIIVFLSVSELSKNKNHEVIIKAIAKIDDPNIHYIICGQGTLDEHLRNLSKALGVENQVHLLGYRKDIVEILKISDIFVFPSYREGLPVALMEAMATGLPVVCSKIRGNSDLIEDGKGGFLIEPGDEEGFAVAINKLISDSRLKNEFCEFNLKKINDFSIENVLKTMKEIYFN